jgi:hypothetical protein
MVIVAFADVSAGSFTGLLHEEPALTLDAAA